MVRKHKILFGLFIFAVATAAIVLTVQMVQANEASQKKLKHDIEMQQILQERKTQEQIKSQKDELQQQIKTLEQRVEAKRANALASAAKAAESVATRVIPHAQASAPVTGSKADWMRAAGIPESQWSYVDSIVSRESGWRYTAVNVSSKATGLCQSLPASKMASAGADYLTNPVTQLRWCNSYAIARYGSWANAWVFWQRNHWW